MRRQIASALLLVIAVSSAGAATPDVEDFVARHWRAPLAPQGPPPARFTPDEAALTPAACGTCHPAQLADWRTSVHARAMGPGVSGQLVEMLESAPADALGCYTCHAPLAEQRPLLGADAKHAKNPAYDPALASHGLVCAACHVRTHERFGPPRRDGALASDAPRDTLPHRGVTRTPAFLASEFCRGCHQFGPDGFVLNGKLLENTYEEWKASRFARENVQCQDCHMPDRRHLWRGIHDAEMVRSGLTITAARSPARGSGGRVFVAATLTVENTRVGHAFPTYVTPRVILRGELTDASGRVVPGSRRETVIAREVALDLSREIRDTRLKPGERARLDYRVPVTTAGLNVRLSVIVEPDAFYTRFFETLLQSATGRGEGEIRQALSESRRSSFTVFVRELPAT